MSSLTRAAQRIGPSLSPQSSGHWTWTLRAKCKCRGLPRRLFSHHLLLIRLDFGSKTRNRVTTQILLLRDNPGSLPTSICSLEIPVPSLCVWGRTQQETSCLHVTISLECPQSSTSSRWVSRTGPTQEEGPNPSEAHGHSVWEETSKNERYLKDCEYFKSVFPTLIKQGWCWGPKESLFLDLSVKAKDSSWV